MPIIDDENQTYDAELSTRFNEHFFSLTNGNLTDSEGNLWYVSQEYELANFVALLETKYRHSNGKSGSQFSSRFARNYFTAV